MTIEEYEFLDTYRTPGTGISDLDYRTIRAMTHPYSFPNPEFHEYWNDTKQMLKRLFQTKNEVIGVVGSIRVMFDVIFSNIVEPGDKILVLTNGYWGTYVKRVVESFDGKAIIHEEKPGRAIDPKKVEDVICKHKDLKAVSVMHVETDTGIVHPVAEIGELVKGKSDSLYIVDCATSFGGMEVKADKWNADFCFSGSHKCMSSPVGLGFTTVSERALENMRNRKTSIKGTYNDIFPWREPLAGECEPPMPLSTINAVRARLEYIFKHGPEKIFKKHEIAAKAFRVALQKMGIKLLAESLEAPPCSNVVTVAEYPSGIDIDKVTKIMSRRYLTALLPSPYREGVFQLGTVNESQVNPRHILYLILTLGLTFSELGVPVKLEEAIKGANEVLLELEKL